MNVVNRLARSHNVFDGDLASWSNAWLTKETEVVASAPHPGPGSEPACVPSRLRPAPSGLALRRKRSGAGNPGLWVLPAALVRQGKCPLPGDQAWGSRAVPPSGSPPTRDASGSPFPKNLASFPGLMVSRPSICRVDGSDRPDSTAIPSNAPGPSRQCWAR